VGIRDLGTRPVPASLRDLLSRFTRGQAPPIQVQRRPIPYWQERGWTQQEENTYTGNYQTAYGAFQGWIEQERSGRLNFYLHNPSQQIRGHSHWTCFQHRNDGWYLIHMGREARDVSSGIMTIERLIAEAYQ
jgi:hypothetical protein